MHAYLHAAPEGIRNMGSSLDAQSSAQPILRGEVPTIKSTLMYVVGKAEARIGYRAIPDSRS